ncbi:MAG: lytic transglycosylase domain-containing protein [Chloroflexi bacterium]|nr:MAG: lytic transglycosylase domain-containing protein [Chloroflexota bacterium]
MRLHREVLPLLGAFILCACGGAAQTTPSPARTTPTAALATPRMVVVDAAYAAKELGNVEAAIRSRDMDSIEFAGLGERQQRAYHLLAAHPDWVPAVLAAVPASVRSTIQDNLTAAQQIDSLNGARSTLPHWRIITPPSADALMGFYREAQQAYGVTWQYLAAINLIETNMGRIQGLSSAGAQGPMQFMPATWASYGNGDVNNPRDAILAAGRYLHAHGAPADMNRAVYAYNPSWLYVRAVMAYARQMFADSRAYFGYYNWQVYVQTTTGEVLLPEGFNG